MLSTSCNTYTPAFRLRSLWVLKKYQMATCAANVTKKEFPSFLSNLLEISFSPDHIKGGFKKAGLSTFNREVIPQLKFDKTLPFAKHPENTTQEERECISVNLVGSCTISDHVTPIRLELKGYFANLLQKNSNPLSTGPVEKCKIKSSFYGEELTTDELYTRLAAEDEKKKREEQQRRREKQQKKRAEKKEEQQRKKEEQQRKKEENRERGRSNRRRERSNRERERSNRERERSNRRRKNRIIKKERTDERKKQRKEREHQ